MKNYIFEWFDGSKSAMSFDKKRAMRGLEHWYKNHENWVYITVKNIKTGKQEVFFEEWKLEQVNELNI